MGLLRVTGRELHIPSEGGTPDSNAQLEENFYFVQLADSQFGLLPTVKGSKSAAVLNPLLAVTNKRIPGDGNPELTEEEAYEREVDFSRRAVAAMNAMEPAPAFAIVCGDMVNAYPPQSKLRARQTADFRKVFGELRQDVPLVCVCGNHDIGDTPTPETAAQYEQEFGNDYFVLWCHGVKCIVMNSQYIKDGSRVPDLASAHREWLEKQLCPAETRNARHVLLFSHIAPFIHSPEEPSAYFNLAVPDRNRLLSLAMDGGVSLWMCGHFHRNAGGVYRPHNSERRLEVVVTTAVGTNITDRGVGDPLGLTGMGNCYISADTSGFRVVKVTKETVSHTFHTIASLDANT